MILVTVGTDLPFDRLVRTVDNWCSENPEEEVFAQIGETEWRPKNFPCCKFMEPAIFKQKFSNADLIISHAGMGTILSSLQFQKPLLVMPRLASLGEHRNEHQLATAHYLSAQNKVNVAKDEEELTRILGNIRNLPVLERIGPNASQSLIERLKAFIQS